MDGHRIFSLRYHEHQPFQRCHKHTLPLSPPTMQPSMPPIPPPPTSDNAASPHLTCHSSNNIIWYDTFHAARPPKISRVMSKQWIWMNWQPLERSRHGDHRMGGRNQRPSCINCAIFVSFSSSCMAGKCHHHNINIRGSQLITNAAVPQHQHQ